MDEEKKKMVKIGIVVVCLIAAGVIWHATREKETGIPSIPADKTTWVKCNNPDCKAEYEMQLREYFEEVEKLATGAMLIAPPIKCKKCGKESILRAEKM